MRLLKYLFIVLLLLPVSARADGMLANKFTTAVAGTSINNIGTSIAHHQITWNVSGTASVCTVALDTSADGITWSAGGAIAGQTCTSNGTSTVANVIANYVRINMTALTVAAGSSVTVTWNGYINTPSSGGGVSGCSTTGGIAFENGTANTLTCGAALTWVSPTHQINNGSTATPTGALDEVRGAGIGSFGALRETIMESAADTAHITESKTAPAGAEFSEFMNNDGSYTMAHFDGTNSTTLTFLAVTNGGLKTGADIETTGYRMNHDNTPGTLLISSTSPSIAANGCGGSAASEVSANGTGAFVIGVGTSNTGTCTVTMPAATTNWICSATDITTTSTLVAITKVVPGGTPTTQITLQNYTDIMGTHAWVDNDHIAINCMAE